MAHLYSVVPVRGWGVAWLAPDVNRLSLAEGPIGQ
jgi:hypothetical protein